MNIATIIGFFAATCTSISFFPQVYKSYKTKKTKDVSLPMFMITFTAAILWFTYGLFLKDLPIIITNMIVASVTLSMLVLKVKYG